MEADVMINYMKPIPFSLLSLNFRFHSLIHSIMECPALASLICIAGVKGRL